jgi:hypothetical protein
MRNSFVFLTTTLFLLLLTFSVFAGKNICNPPSAAMIQRSQQFLQNTPCAPVVTACNQGGFVLNCHSSNGKGLEVDCISHLNHGQAVPGVSMQPNDQNIVNCKAFCKQNKGACSEQKNTPDR